MVTKIAGIVGLSMTILTLGGCLAIPDDEVPGATPTDVMSEIPDETTELVEVIPEFIPGGSAQDNLPYIDLVLTDAGAGSGLFGSLDAVAALEAAGFSRQDIEVTSDRTRLELSAESVTIAVRVGEECALGQWSSSWYSSAVEPILASGTCLVGDTLSLD